MLNVLLKYYCEIYIRSIRQIGNVSTNHFSTLAVMDPLLISAWFSWMFIFNRVCKSSRSVTITCALQEFCFKKY